MAKQTTSAVYAIKLLKVAEKYGLQHDAVCLDVDKFHVTPRTLRRRLKDEGTCYTDLVLEFKMSMSRQYLRQSNLTVGEISDLVGYQNAVNFYRIFLREYNMTPSEFRASCKGAAP